MLSEWKVKNTIQFKTKYKLNNNFVKNSHKELLVESMLDNIVVYSGSTFTWFKWLRIPKKWKNPIILHDALLKTGGDNEIEEVHYYLNTIKINTISKFFLIALLYAKEILITEQYE